MRKLFPFYWLRLFSSLSNQFLQFAVPLMIYKSTGSVAWSGIAFFIEWLPRIFAFPLAGAAADRFGPRTVYLVADVIRLLASTLAFLGLLIFPKQAHLFLIGLAVVTGFFFEYAFIAVEKAVRKLAPQSKMHHAQSVLSSIDHATLLGGPALAGFFVTLFQPRALVAVTAGIFLVSVVIIVKADNGALRPESNRKSLSLVSELQFGFRTLFGIRKLVYIVLLTNILNFMLGLNLIIVPAMTTGIFAMPDEYLGMVYSVSGVAGLIAVAATFWLANWFKISWIGIIAFLIACAAFLGIGIASTFWLYTAAVAILMAMDGVFTVYIRTERARIIPAEQFGSTVGIVVLLNFVPMPFAGLLTVGGTGSINLQMLIVLVAVVALVLSLPLLRPLVSDTKQETQTLGS